MRLYEHPSSGNCLKCRIVLRQLGLAYESVPVDLFLGETPGLANDLEPLPGHAAQRPI